MISAVTLIIHLNKVKTKVIEQA